MQSEETEEMRAEMRRVEKAIPTGFEPVANCLEGSCSIQLSYGIC
jgi:hypothetical protein